MKYSLLALLLLIAGGFTAWLILFLKMHEWMGQLLGLEECLWSTITMSSVVALGALRGDKLWVVGLATMVCTFLAYLGYVTHHERIHKALSHAAIFVLYLGLFIDLTKPCWKKRLRRFKRQR